MEAVRIGYRAMDDAGLRTLLGEIPSVRDRLGSSPDAWTISEVGDGNLNLVFIVDGQDGHAVVVKQALPYVRLVGESWPLPLERAHFEHMALLAQAEQVPHLVPEVYFYDQDLALIVMEFLTPHVIMRKGLIRGVEYPNFSDDIAEFLARTLFFTSALGSPAHDHKARIAAFAGNTALCRITEDLVFSDPYFDAPLNRWTKPGLDSIALSFRKDSTLKRCAQERKHQFITSAQALIHGDLHTGSIMVTPDSTKVIDPEFAFVGPMGFDIGAVLANLFLAYFSQAGHEAAPGARGDYKDWILEQTLQVWTGTEAKFLSLWREHGAGDVYQSAVLTDCDEDRGAMAVARSSFMRSVFEDAVAFAGCKMIRRILGLAHVEDLESIADPDRRAACEKKALLLGREFVIAANGFSSVGDTVQMARSLEAEMQ